MCVKKILLWSLILEGSAGCIYRQRSPAIVPFKREFSFAQREDMYLKFPILTTSGKTRFEVECASPFSTGLKKADSAYDWSREFECRVGIPNANGLPDTQLLEPNGQADLPGMSRGGFFWSELYGRCAHDPYWGADRKYRFRGLSLEIAVSKVRFRKNQRHGPHEPFYFIEGLNVAISGRPDPSARKLFGGGSPEKEPRLLDSKFEGGFQNCRKADRSLR